MHHTTLGVTHPEVSTSANSKPPEPQTLGDLGVGFPPKSLNDAGSGIQINQRSYNFYKP